MCDAFFQSYANEISSFSDTAQDMAPTILTFSGPNCTGTFSPNTDGGHTKPQAYPVKGETINVPIQPKSFYIPPGVTVSARSDTGSHLGTYHGPWLVEDTSKHTYPGSSLLASEHPVVKFIVVTAESWEDTVVPRMCMDEPMYLSGNPLVRYTMGSDRCDQYTQDTYCKRNPGAELCNCIEGIARIAKLGTLKDGTKVSVPVTCFDDLCATTKSYKTSAMQKQPCNFTICQQKINLIGENIFDGSTHEVFCGNTFFSDEAAENAEPTISDKEFTSSTVATSTTETPYYVWVMIGVSGVIFILLIFLMFSPKPKKSVRPSKSRAPPLIIPQVATTPPLR